MDFPRAPDGAIVVSHRKDADGISSAAMIRSLTSAEIFLTDYADMAETLSRIKNCKELFVCDLGLNPTTFGAFFDELQRLRIKEGASVHYIDHHPINSEYRSKLTVAGVDIYHSTEECTSVLIYTKYLENLKDSPKMKILACCGAITDYMDSRLEARKLIGSFDRQFLLYEATVLSFSIATIGRGGKESNRRLIELARDLASGKLPHEIDGASEYAQTYAKRAALLMEKIRDEGVRRKNFAYFKTRESATGNVANFLIGAFDVPVGVAIREEEVGFYEISLRSREGSSYDLGKIVGRIASRLGASGGGHPNASGARIRKSQLEQFLKMLEEELSKS